MRPADVVLQLCANRRLTRSPGEDTERAAYRAWVELVETLKPGPAKQPMSPLEVQRARLVLGALRDALDRAVRANPSWFCDAALTQPRQADTEYDRDEFGVARSKKR